LHPHIKKNRDDIVSNTDSILSMTEHGAYVWPSYGIVTLVLVGLVVFSLRVLKNTRAELDRAEALRERDQDET
jgi:heme exporter protein CcmD